jgi:dipeptidyl aminopeptidase/acylaminoacyl peptidase
MPKAKHSPLPTACVLAALLASQSGNASRVMPPGAGLTPEIALQLRVAAAVALSPDGRDIAYRVDQPRSWDELPGPVHGALWQVPFAGGTPLRIANTGVQPRAPAWAPDGAYLAWIAQDDASKEARIFLRSVDGAVRVLAAEVADIEAFAWSADSTRIAFTALDADTPEQAAAKRMGRDWTVLGESAGHKRLYVVNVHTGATNPVTQADLTVNYFDWSPDGRRLVIAAAPSPSEDDALLHSEPYVVDSSGSVPHRLVSHYGRLAHTVWSADGRSVAWLASTALNDPWSGTVFVMGLEDQAKPRAITSDLDGSGVWLGKLADRPGTLALLAEVHQNTVLYQIDLRTGHRTILAEGRTVMSGAPSFARDGRRFAAVGSAPDHPAEIFAGDGKRALRRITSSNPELHGVALGEQTVTSWKSPDGLTIEGVLVKPVGYQEGTRYPIVLHVHGGSESVALNSWLGSHVNWGQLLAARGYVTLYPNYRGSRGRGPQFAAGNRRDVMGREFEDQIAGLEHAVATGLADPARAGIYGFSWGGYAAGWGATFASQRFKAAVAGAGIYNWISEAGSNDTRMHEQLAHWDAPLYEHFLLYLERSPIYEIRRAATPILLLHGERDESCPVGQAIEFHTALRWKGVPSQLVIYPREGHGMSEQAHRLDFVTRGLSWFDRYLGASDAR